MSWKIAVAAASVLMALNACAPQRALARSPVEPGDRAGRHCFWTNQVTSFAAVDERIVNVRVGVKDVYQFEMFGRCHDIDWSQKIALVSRGGSSICSGLDAEVVTGGPVGPHRCPVRNIRKLTDAEIAALPPKARP